MRKLFPLYVILTLLMTLPLSAQERRVENRPYTDLRHLHFGIVIGANLQETEFENVGLQTLSMPDGSQMNSEVYVDQDKWDFGFNVGVLAELRLNQYFAFRAAPQLYFGTRHLTFLDHNNPDDNGNPSRDTETMKAVYVGGDFDLIYASKRFNNHRPYLMAGLAPLWNVSTKSSDNIQLKASDVFLEVGIGCDFYLPFFKLRPELKFMYGLTNCLDKDRIKNLNDGSLLPYAASVTGAHSKMFSLSFYFE